jgi:enamine deaminase RidA (YjgF/YER057c/UK114 family)
MPRRLRPLAVTAGLSAALLVTAALAADITRVPIPNSTFPISQAVRVPAGTETIYFSGLTPPAVKQDAPKDSPEAYGGDTEAQATGAFDRLGAALQAQGLGFGDVVGLRVYLVGDPAKGGKMDFAGFQSAYTKYFATATQPNKPARTTVQVAGLAAAGVFVEIEATAAK